MAETAAFLVDEVIPNVPVRQWVLSVPYRVRFALARDAKLLTKALGIFIGEVFRDVRKRTGTRAGVGKGRELKCGAVTGVQRFGGSLNLNVHFHAIVLDGVYRDGKEGPEFVAAPRPRREDLEGVLSRARWRIERMLRRAGIRSDDEEPAVEMETLELFQAASIQQRVAISSEAQRVPVVGREEGRPLTMAKKGLCAEAEGYDLHAGVRMKAGDRTGLEILCRYVMRPSFSEERLERLPDGRIAYGFRRAWEDGSSHILLTPLQVMEKLAALIPPPRYHLVRYHGVLAPHAKRRKRIVKGPAADGAHEVCACAMAASDPVLPALASPPLGVEATALLSPPSGAVTAEGPHVAEIAPLAPSVGGGAMLRADEVESRDALPGGVTSPRAPAAGSAVSTVRGELPGVRNEVLPPALPTSVPVATRRPRRKRLSWATLMMRTLGLDVLACPRCGERMKVIACIDQPAVIEKILRAVGLWEDEPAGRPSGGRAWGEDPWASEHRDQWPEAPPNDPWRDAGGDAL
jgi:hypothetical protein